ncbi:succinate dehydrogenase membrane anchor subunit [soil metagenome]
MASISAATKRLPWWAGPITVSTVLVLFGLYSMTIVFFFPNGNGGEALLSPFYSPQVGLPGWMPGFVTAPMLVLWIPLGFRATCYYYRKAYYRSFFWDPPNCSETAQQHEPRKQYNGERALFVLNNIHRYFLYASIIVVAFLWYEATLAFFPGGSFGITVGTLILLINIVLVSAYTFSCHSFRHLVGGNKDCNSCVSGRPSSTGGNAVKRFRRKTYNGVSKLNKTHANWAWYSLFSLLIADIYIRLLQAGVITDLQIL